MRKAVQTLVAAGALALSSGAMAQYITVAGGASKFDFDCTGTTSCDNEDTAWKAVFGWRFGNSGFAGELGYIDWGAGNGTVFGSNVELGLRSTTIGIAYRGAFAQDWEAYFRLGAALNEAKTSVSMFGSGTDDSTNPYFGLGIRYALSKNIKLDLSADFTQGEWGGEKGDASAVMIGVTIDF